MNQKVVDELNVAKEFVEINGDKDTTEEIADEILDLLREAIEAAQNDDISGVLDALDAIDGKAVSGWDLTSRVRELCE